MTPDSNLDFLLIKRACNARAGMKPHGEHRGTHKSNLLIGVKISSTPAVFISETDRPPMRGSAYRSRLRIQFCA